MQFLHVDNEDSDQTASVDLNLHWDTSEQKMHILTLWLIKNFVLISECFVP